MLRAEDGVLVLGGELVTGVEHHAQVSSVGHHFDLGLDILVRQLLGDFVRGVLIGTHIAAAIVGVAVPQAVHQFAVSANRHFVQFAGRGFVAHAVNLVVGPPQAAILGVESQTRGIAQTVQDHLAVAAVTVEADNAADTGLHVQVLLLGWGHVEGLAQGDVDAVVRSDCASTRGVVVGLFFRRNQVALLDHGKCHGVRAFGEVFDSGEHHHAVALSDVQETVRRVAQAGRGVELDAGAEVFNCVSDVVHVAVIREVDVLLAGTDPDCGGIAADSNGAGIRHHGEHVNLEAIGQLDVGQHLFQIGDVGGVLRNALGRRGIGFLERTQLFQIGIVRETNTGNHRECCSDRDCSCTALQHSSKSTSHVVSKRISPAGRICGPFLTVPNPRAKRHTGGTWKRL